MEGAKTTNKYALAKLLLQPIKLGGQCCNVLFLGIIRKSERVLLALEALNVLDSAKLVEIVGVHAERVDHVSHPRDMGGDAFGGRWCAG